MNLWKQSRQHLIPEVMHLAAALSPIRFLTFFSKYSNTTLSIQMTASKKEPTQRDPKLYLRAHQNPLESGRIPLLSAVLEKYQQQTPTIITYWKIATISSTPQKSPKT
jgi:hypothetical protein